jgi:hypothetical protein
VDVHLNGEKMDWEDLAPVFDFDFDGLFEFDLDLDFDFDALDLDFDFSALDFEFDFEGVFEGVDWDALATWGGVTNTEKQGKTGKNRE